MKMMLRMGAVALAIVLAARLPAEAAPPWIVDIPIDVTALTQGGGYAPSQLGLLLQCHIFSAANPSLEVGYGYVKHVPVAPSGVTRVRVVASPNGHAQDKMPVTYRCDAGVGPIAADVEVATTGNVGSGPITAPPLPTKGAPIVMKLVTPAAPSGHSAHLPTAPNALLTLPPQPVPPEDLPILSARITNYGPTTITTCPATVTYSVRVSSRVPGTQFSYGFRMRDDMNVDAPIDTLPSYDIVKKKFRDLTFTFQANTKGTHYVWFQIFAPQPIILPLFRYDVPCGT